MPVTPVTGWREGCNDRSHTGPDRPRPRGGAGLGPCLPTTAADGRSGGKRQGNGGTHSERGSQGGRGGSQGSATSGEGRGHPGKGRVGAGAPGAAAGTGCGREAGGTEGRGDRPEAGGGYTTGDAARQARRGRAAARAGYRRPPSRLHSVDRRGPEQARTSGGHDPRRGQTYPDRPDAGRS